MVTSNPFETIDLRLEKIESSLEKLIQKPEPLPSNREIFLTTDEVCDTFKVSRVSLWNWDKKGITKPVRFGNLKRYRLSDIENMGETEAKASKYLSDES